MNVRAGITTEKPAGDILARLHDVKHWASWLGSAFTISADGDGPRVEASFDIALPIPLHLRVDVDRHDDGVSVSFIEGDLSGVHLDIDVSDHDGRREVALDLWAQFPTTIPGAMLREMEHEVVPRWLGALVS